MNVGGLSKRIVKVALALVGHKRGGLGYVTIIASILLASLSGSAVADAAALATPAGAHDDGGRAQAGQACGLVAAGGIIGPVILRRASPSSCSGWPAACPSPSCSWRGSCRVLMGAGLAITWWLISRNDHEVQIHEKASKQELIVALREGIWALFPAGDHHLRSGKFGIFTPTEARRW